MHRPKEPDSRTARRPTRQAIQEGYQLSDGPGDRPSRRPRRQPLGISHCTRCEKLKRIHQSVDAVGQYRMLRRQVVDL